MITRVKRRYLRRNFHPAFGYYIGCSVVKAQGAQVIKSNAPAAFGKPELCSETTVLDLPIVWNKEEAKEAFAHKQEFGFIASTEKGVTIGYVDKDTYETHKGEKPCFDVVVDAAPYFKQHKL
ncbi:MAG: hypothetical protein M1378_11935 [Bacteroidetes bacterium]|nr:hypothetical protein [Bacteroidota bacterium]